MFEIISNKSLFTTNQSINEILEHYMQFRIISTREKEPHKSITTDE